MGGFYVSLNVLFVYSLSFIKIVIEKNHLFSRVYCVGDGGNVNMCVHVSSPFLGMFVRACS